MLQAADNELLTRVGRGTPMGNLMSHFWFPVLKLSDLIADGAPQRVRLLGENYVVFRATDGRIAAFEEACPHRGASLVLARNKDCALRCIFHGWQFSVDGSVVDVPSVPNAAAFSSKVPLRKLHTHEAAGLLWLFAGSGEPSQFPCLPFTGLPDTHVYAVSVDLDCNYAQILEGQIDGSHVGILHEDNFRRHRDSRRDSGRASNFSVLNTPTYEVEDTSYGFRSAALRSAGDGSIYARVAEFVVPAAVCIDAAPQGVVFYQTPVDDTHTRQWIILYDEHAPVESDYSNLTFDLVFRDETSGFHAYAVPGNNWAQDRAAMADGHPTGLRNFLVEDFVVSESMGAIVDRSREYLSVNDAAIARFRRIMLEAARHFADGKPVRGLDQRVPYEEIRGWSAVFPATLSWREALEQGYSVPA